MRRQQGRAIILMAALIIIATLSAGATGFETLRPGAEGEAVRTLQLALESIGHPLKPDGKYGAITERAVKQFQSANRLTADGLAGRQTLSELFRQAPAFLEPYQQALQTSPGQRQEPVQTQQPERATPSHEPIITSAGTAIVHTNNKGSLNLRSRPTYGQTTIAQLPHGSQVEVLGTSGSWTQVKAMGQTGYVLSSFLRFGQTTGEQSPPSAQPQQETPSPTAKPEPTQAPVSISGVAQVHTANRGSLNLRDRAQSGAKVLLQLPYGTTLNVLARLGVWTQVSHQGQTGFVMDNFLRHGTGQTETPSTTPQPTPTPVQSAMPSLPPLVATQVAFVNNQPGRTLNLRSGPTEGDNIIGSIPSGAAVLLTSRGEAWSGVLYEGQQGYVMNSFLRFEQEQAGSPSDAPTATPSPVPSLQPTASPSPEPVEEQPFPRTLREGSQGEDVRELQTRLAALKYTVSINANFDAMTKEAVQAFQLQNSLTVDGVFGSQSASILLSGRARTALDKPLDFKTLRIDNKNSSVGQMQQALLDLGFPLKVNNNYDVATHQAVVGFQQRNGLPITGVANAHTQAAIFSGNAKGYATAVSSLGAEEGKGGGPSTGQVSLLHWFRDVKPRIASGQRITVYHPASDTNFVIRLYSLGNHADSEPATWRDTQLMNRAFGTPSWNINPVYVLLPDGRWTLAAMHNRPHLSGAISENGFGGHLCIHFLRDMDETQRNNPDYGVSNQRAIRKAWQGMTGENID